MSDFADTAAEKIADDIDDINDGHRAEYRDFGDDFLARISTVIREAYAPREAAIANLVRAAEETIEALNPDEHLIDIYGIKQEMLIEAEKELRQVIADTKEKR